MRIEGIREIITSYRGENGAFKQNLAKEYLQMFVLKMIYGDQAFQNLVFYGGSCLRHCFELPRLSEDLDFVDLTNTVELPRLAERLKEMFDAEFDMITDMKIQKFRIYLKFPLLRELKLTGPNESDFLHLKIEIFNRFDYCSGYTIETLPLFRFGISVLVRTFDLPTLMATKINAVLARKWKRMDADKNMLATVKGRDYYDLFWYLNKKIEPNMRCVPGLPLREQWKQRMWEAVEKVDVGSIAYDLSNFFADQQFVRDFAKHYKDIMKKYLV